jgi:malonate-semialdehyde dehydrogenase (acetylating)/methylmalonate-semialdehyde dehydrogenase
VVTARRGAHPRLVKSGVEQGAELVVDGRNFKMQGYENGYFIGGCLFDNVTRTWTSTPRRSSVRCCRWSRAKTYAEASACRWSHEYGNGTAIYTRDGDAARDFASRINIGMVGVNVPIPVPLAYHTFGGWKKSASATSTSTARTPSGSIRAPRR